MVLGTGLVALGYAHTLAYGFAVSHPTEVCGQRTLDADFPLTRTRVDVFPPRLECYWADSSAYGPSHPTAAGGWLIWIGAALLVAGVVAWAVQLHSRMPRWARAGVILAPAVAAAIWITRVDRFMDLSTVDLRNECFSLQVAHLHSAPAVEVVSTDRSFLPPAVDCVFTDGTTSLILIETLGLWSCLAVFLVCCAMFLRRTAEAAVGGHEPR